MSIVEGQGEAGYTWNDTTSFWLVSVNLRGLERKLETQGMVHLHFGRFMSIVEGQEEAGDTGDDTPSF